LEQVSDVIDTENGEIRMRGMPLEVESQLDVDESTMKKELDTMRSDLKLETKSTKLEVETIGINVVQDIGSMKQDLESLGGLIKGLVNHLTPQHTAITPEQQHASSGSHYFVKKLWEQLHNESWLVNPQMTNRALEDLGVGSEQELALLDKAQLDQLVEHFKPIPKRKFLSAFL